MEESYNLIKEILGTDLSVKVLDFEQVKTVLSKLEEQGVRVGRLHTSMIGLYGYRWREKGLPVNDQKQELYLDCLARANELEKISWQPVTS